MKAQLARVMITNLIIEFYYCARHLRKEPDLNLDVCFFMVIRALNALNNMHIRANPPILVNFS